MAEQILRAHCEEGYCLEIIDKEKETAILQLHDLRKAEIITVKIKSSELMQLCYLITRDV